MNEELRDWDQQIVADFGFDDTAAPNRRSRVAVGKRQALAETASLLNKPCVQVLYDIAKFFDTINLDLLLPWAEQHGFPVDLLVILSMMHLAPRSLRTQSCFADTVVALARSILMGCTSSTRLARGACYQVLPRTDPAMRDFPQHSTTGAHVDDVNHLCIGHSEAHVHDTTVDYGTDLLHNATRYGLDISAKTLVTSNRMGLARRVARSLRAVGVPLHGLASGRRPRRHCYGGRKTAHSLRLQATGEGATTGTAHEATSALNFPSCYPA